MPDPIPTTTAPLPAVSVTPEQQKRRAIAFGLFVLGMVASAFQNAAPKLMEQHPQWTWIAPTLAAISGAVAFWQKWKDVLNIFGFNFTPAEDGQQARQDDGAGAGG